MGGKSGKRAGKICINDVSGRINSWPKLVRGWARRRLRGRTTAVVLPWMSSVPQSMAGNVCLPPHTFCSAGFLGSFRSLCQLDSSVGVQCCLSLSLPLPARFSLLASEVLANLISRVYTRLLPYVCTRPNVPAPRQHAPAGQIVATICILSRNDYTLR